MVERGSVVFYERDEVLEDVLKMFADKADVKLVKSGKFDKKAIGVTLDNGANGIVNGVIEGDVGRLKVAPVEGKVIKPLYLFLDEEVELYAKLRKLGYKKIKKGNSISKFVDGLEEKHPEVKRAVVNGYLRFN